MALSETPRFHNQRERSSTPSKSGNITVLSAVRRLSWLSVESIIIEKDNQSFAIALTDPG
jgi:hypothetical protein